MAGLRVGVYADSLAISFYLSQKTSYLALDTRETPEMNSTPSPENAEKGALNTPSGRVCNIKCGLKIAGLIILCYGVLSLALYGFDLSSDTISSKLLESVILAAILAPVIFFMMFRPSMSESGEVSQRLRNHEFALNQHTILAETDIKGTITNVNQMFCDISGYSRDELLGQNHRILNSGRHSHEFWRDMYLAVSKGNVWKGEICNRAKSGKEYWVRTTIVPIVGQSGVVERYIALRTDVSEIIEQRNNLDSALATVERVKEEQDKLFAVVAHEMRTPAASISMLLNNHSHYEQENLIDLLKGNTEHLLSIMDDIKAVVNADADVFKEIESVHILALLQSTIDSLSDRFLYYGVECQLEAEPLKEIIARTNRQIVRQVVSNLVKNAALHSGGENIWLSADREMMAGGKVRVVIRVADDGTGISGDFRETIFNAFERGQSSAPGSGIGLNVSRELARSQGGDLVLEDRDGGGSVFVYSFIAEVEESQNALAPAANPESLLDGKKFLLVEDNPTIAKITQVMLKRAGATVVLARDGQAGLEAFDDSIDLVLTDIMMPKMDGYQMVSELRQLGFAKPIVAVSAATIGDEMERMLSCGATLVISKPVDLQTLATKLAQETGVFSAAVNA